jgi:hypothetical protein
MSLKQTSKDAIAEIKTGKEPRKAWIDAISKNYPHSISMQKKGCPRDAFLGLCSEGLLKDVNADKYTKSTSNKQYAIAAVELLKKNGRENYSSIKLWLDVLKFLKQDINKQHNGQMDVVLSLWDESFIK